jgi:hypothetical protein
MAGQVGDESVGGAPNLSHFRRRNFLGFATEFVVEAAGV